MKSIALLLGVFVALSIAAPLLHQNSAKAIAGQYIVVFNTQVSEEARDAHVNNLLTKSVASNRNDAVLTRFGHNDFQGYSATLSKESLAEILADENIQFVEADQIVNLATTQEGATWGLNRISERNLNLDGKYHYAAQAGTGVNSYIVDTGIYIAHNEFAGRAVWGINYADTTDSDCNGHGTHVAGTVGGTIYGVAKKTSLIAVKVLNCQGSGTNSGVINGVTWAANHRKSSNKPGVANMSLGGGVSTALDQAVTAAVEGGLNFAVAAGNENSNACNSSPSRTAVAICVGATDNKDARSSFSNYGTCVDVFAPGTSITAAWIGSVSATNTISGTSMATPHVAGAVALYLSTFGGIYPDTTTIHDWVKVTATPNKITNVGTGSPNLLLFSHPDN